MFLQKLLQLPTSTFVRQTRRLYSTTKSIKEFCQVIDPRAFIKINSIWNLRIRPYDLLDCQDGNLIRASLQPIDTSTTLDTLDVDVNAIKLDIEGKPNRITIQAGLSEGEVASSSALDKVICVLDVPVKSNLTIRSEQGVDVQNLGGALVDIECNGSIRTKNMQQAHALRLESKAGNIDCEGNTLTDQIQLKVYGGNVSSPIIIICFNGNIM